MMFVDPLYSNTSTGIQTSKNRFMTLPATVDNSQETKATTTESENTNATNGTDALTGTDTSDFEALLSPLLSPNEEGVVSEEQLFASLLAERITKLKGNEAGAEFKALLEEQKEKMKSSKDGYIPYEEAARTALREYATAGKLTSDEVSKIHSEAFGAAQLDENLDVLFDDRGSESDLTKAVSDKSAAIASAKTIIDQYDAGSLTATARPFELAFDSFGFAIINPYYNSLNAYSSSANSEENPLKDPGPALEANSVTYKTPQAVSDNARTSTWEFLWKPIGENSKKLVVLPRAGTDYDVQSIVLKDKNGNVIEEGTHYDAADGSAHPDSARKFNFTKPGAAYEKNLLCEVTMTNGAKVVFDIPNPSQRYEQSRTS